MYDEDAFFTIPISGVLTNDSDADDHAIKIVYSDTVTVYSVPVTLNLDGSFTYDPNLSAVVQALTPTQTIFDSFTYTIEDTFNAQDTATVVITVTGLNDAPVLDNSGNPTLPSVEEDTANPLGTSVADIIASAGGDRITDVDNGAVEGIAITSRSNNQGTWQYTTTTVASGLIFQMLIITITVPFYST